MSWHAIVDNSLVTLNLLNIHNSTSQIQHPQKGPNTLCKSGEWYLEEGKSEIPLCGCGEWYLRYSFFQILLYREWDLSPDLQSGISDLPHGKPEYHSSVTRGIQVFCSCIWDPGLRYQSWTVEYQLKSKWITVVHRGWNHCSEMAWTWKICFIQIWRRKLTKANFALRILNLNNCPKLIQSCCNWSFYRRSTSIVCPCHSVGAAVHRFHDKYY